MKPYLFSICIPTWDRHTYLAELLEGISSEISGDSEYQVVVGDNCSQDDTYQTVAKYFDKLNIKYIRRDRNIGSMLNVVSVLMEGDGQYCILMGDDDKFREGWLALLKNLVTQYSPDIISSNRFICDIKMNVKGSEQCGPVVTAPTLYQCGKPGVLLEYLNNTKSTSGFGFLSNLVIRQSAWVAAVDSEYVNRHPFAHMIKIMDILYNKEGSILRVPFETVLARTGNDRLEELMAQPDATEFDKLMLHLDGFVTAAEFIFPHSRSHRSALLTPINNIFSSEYKNYFPVYAERFNKKDFAMHFIQRLEAHLS